MAQMDVGQGAGPAFSFTSISFSVAGRTYSTLTTLNIDRSAEPGELRGVGPNVTNWTDGDTTFGGSFTLPLPDYFDFNDLIKDANSQWGLRQFNISVVYELRDAPSNVYQTECLDCVITGAPTTFSRGNEALMVEVSFRCKQVVDNGVVAYSDFAT